MERLRWLARFGLVFAAFLAVDMVWLVFVARKFYVGQIGYLMREPVNFTAAVVFYVIFVVGILVFVLQPALEKNSLGHAALYGAFFGLVTYATYDLTNLSTVKDWPVLVTVVDLAWGTTLSLLVAVLGFLAIRRWVPLP